MATAPTRSPTEELPESLPGSRPGSGPRRSGVAVVVNPTKLDGGSALRDQVTAALAARQLPAPLWLETSEQDPGFGMTEQALAQGAGVVIACGGDGTVRAVLTVLAGTGVPLAVLPAGTGNLLARNLGLPVGDLAAAIEVALAGQDRAIDVGRLEPPDGEGRHQRFAIMAGVGLDAAIMRDAPEDVKARVGWAAYVLSALKHVRRQGVRVRLEIDGREVMNARVQTVVIGNMGRLQGGVQLLPEAAPDDGALDIAVLAGRGLLDWARIIGRVVTRRADLDQRFRTFRAERVSVILRDPQPRQADGDLLAPGRLLEARIEPAAVLVRVPVPVPVPAEGSG